MCIRDSKIVEFPRSSEELLKAQLPVLNPKQMGIITAFNARERTVVLDQEEARNELTPEQQDQNIINNHWVLSELVVLQIEPVVNDMENRANEIITNGNREVIGRFRNQIQTLIQNTRSIYNSLNSDPDYRDTPAVATVRDLFNRLQTLSTTVRN